MGVVALRNQIAGADVEKESGKQREHGAECIRREA